MKFIDMAIVVPGMSVSVVAHVNVFSSFAYSCEVRKPGVKEQSVEMAHNGAGAVIPPEHHADVALI